MRNEIHEQPEALASTLGQYVQANAFRLDTCELIFGWLKNIHSKIVIAASGSSRHAGLVAQLLLKDLSGLSVDVEYASEYSSQRLEGGSDAQGVIVISQSGETADTLAALRKAKSAGLETLALTNVVHSTMAREASASFPIMAGAERAVPATKSFTAQLLNLYLLSLMSAAVHGRLDPAQLKIRLAEVEALPAHIATQLELWEETARRIVDGNRRAGNFIFLGRGIHYPIALEGALKLKESAYIHAQGYPSGELKHGPNALVTRGTPLIMIATVYADDPDSWLRYEKVIRLMREMRTQGADIIAIANRGDSMVAELATHVIFVEETREVLMTICEVIPLQMFAYWFARTNGVDADHPRNLTKAVLAE